MTEVTGGTRAKSAAAAVRMTTRAASGEAWDPVAASIGGRGIGGKPRCC